MARRILSADSLLMPQAQSSLDSVRTEKPGEMELIQRKWSAPLPPSISQLLFDWERRDELMEEIKFVNRAQEMVDEASVKIAPSVLRIVLTVKANLDDPAAQRAFLEENLELDFRRISELCIVADSYALLDAARRLEGAREIERYGWSKALKLSAVRDPVERQAIWAEASGQKQTASYREVLEGIRRFRERKLIGASPQAEQVEPLDEALSQARGLFDAFNQAAGHLESAEACKEALDELARLQKELNQVKAALTRRLKGTAV